MNEVEEKVRIIFPGQGIIAGHNSLKCFGKNINVENHPLPSITVRRIIKMIINDYESWTCAITSDFFVDVCVTIYDQYSR